MQMIVHLKKVARFFLDVLLLTWGLVYYHLNKSKPLNERTPPQAYLAMIRLFCVTGGYSNDVISWCISLFDKPLDLPDNKGVLGDLSNRDLKFITHSLDKDGFYIFENKLPLEQIEALIEFALTQKCRLRKLDTECSNTPSRFERYDRQQLKTSLYDIPEEFNASNILVQKLLTDHSILSVAQHYLRASPKVDPVAFWWSTPFAPDPQSNAAQLYHFDMDRLKWLKFFIFLTDVTLETGPHVFIKGSHRTGAIPYALRKCGYSRHADKDVEKYFEKTAIQTFTVPKGTLFAEDTRGLHKGTNLIKGERLVLELQFSNCSFGAFTSSLANVTIEDKSIIAFVNRHKRIFNLYPIERKM